MHFKEILDVQFLRLSRVLKSSITHFIRSLRQNAVSLNILLKGSHKKHSVSRLVKELLTKMLREVTSISKWWGGATRPTKMKPKTPGSQLKSLYIKLKLKYEDSENMKTKRVIQSFSTHIKSNR